MKFAILGAGGVGAYLGARLAKSGHPVALIARGAHAEALQQHGVRIQPTPQTQQSPWVAHPAFVTDTPAQVGVCDVVITASKNYHLDELLGHAQPMIGPRTLILTLQNGITAYQRVAELYGTAATLPGLIYCELSVEEPGVIRSGIEPVRLTYGPLPPHAISPLAQALMHALNDAGAPTTVVPDGRAALWSKAIFVAAMSAVTTLTQAPLGPMLADSEIVETLTAALTEARKVAEADGVRFDGDPVASALATARSMPATARSSMARDVANGRPTEVESLNGAVVAKGRALGVTTPVNQALYALLRLRSQQEISA
ncbi:MAG: ketopantoate reductase family protein [Chloroflexota bacterium]|jgi:2-dehydropantoate 2-reductase